MKSVARRMPIAIARSSAGPSFFTSAGARLMIAPCAVKAKPLLIIARRTRSMLSFTAACARPTTVVLSIPCCRQSISISHSSGSMPTRMKLCVRASKRDDPFPGENRIAGRLIAPVRYDVAPSMTIIRLFLAAVVLFVLIAAVSFVYFKWWQALLVCAAVLVSFVALVRVTIALFVRKLGSAVGGMLEKRGEMLKGATVEVHSIGLAAKPTERQQIEDQNDSAEDPGEV